MQRLNNELQRNAGLAGWLQKIKGEGAELPPKSSLLPVMIAGLGSFILIASLAGLASSFEATLVLGSFGASCVLVFGFPDAPFSQPRNILAGHTLSSLVGLLCLTYLGPAWWSMALAVSLAVMLMMATRTVHPPAGSNPVIVFLAQPAWDFLLFPTVVGALGIVLVALLYNNLSREGSYPQYW
ncbi:HPP family protein [Motiliproteus sediminis]|uniref:HPP family protein n=1 Tax=Motiliproteus sediminis TaxID=1468178 RepID=UPI001AF006B0|nr:HPP family protein [Motiliproteus sediminis]